MSLTRTVKSAPGRTVQVASRAVSGIGFSMLAVMMFLTASDVALRYVFNRPIPGAYELTEFMMPILVAFGLAYTAVHKGHIRIDFLIARLSPRVLAFIDSITTLVGLGIFSLIAWQSIVYALFLEARGLATPTLGIPIYPVVYVIAAGCVLFCLVFILELAVHLSQVLGKGRWEARAGFALGIVAILFLFVTPVLKDVMPQISPFAVGVIGVCALVVLISSGMLVAVACAAVGFLGITYLVGVDTGLSSLGRIPHVATASYAWSVLPLFLLMASFCFHSGITRDLYAAAYRWIGRLPGGLAMASVIACGSFAAVSGTGPASVAAVGTVALPEMKRYNYDTKLATGCVIAGSTVGGLIPPSMLFILYAMLAEQSIGRLFIAGILPGITAVICYIITIYIMCKRNPLMGPSGESSTLIEKLAALKGTWAILALFVLVIGGIYFGVFGPTEGAGIGAFGAFLLTLFRRRLTWPTFTASLIETGKTTAMIFVIFIGVTLFSQFLALSRFPYELAGFVAELPVSRYVILLAILCVMLVFGCFMGGMPTLMLTIPIFYPLITTLDFHPIWFGVLAVKMGELGALTPPMGLSLFVMKGIAGDIPMSTIFKGVGPFLIADAFHIAILVAFPVISLVLPNIMM